MASFELPLPHIESYIVFSELSSEKQDIVLNIIKDYKKGVNYKELTQQISDSIGIDYDEAEIFIEAYFTLLRTKYARKYNNEDFLNAIIDSIIEEDEYSHEDIEHVKIWIGQLLELSNDDALITAISISTISDNTNVLYYARIHEELRPIFLNEDFAGLTLYHTLRIHYKKPGGDHTDMYFALDTNDIDNMIDLLTKAKEKTEKLQLKFQSDLINI